MREVSDLAEDIIKDVSMVNLADQMPLGGSSSPLRFLSDLWARSIFGFYCNFFNKPAANSLGIWPYSVPSIRPLILRFCHFECPSRSRHLLSSGMFHLRFQIRNTVCFALCRLLQSIQFLGLWRSLILATSAILSSILSQMSVIIYNLERRDAIAVNMTFSFRSDTSSPSG